MSSLRIDQEVTIAAPRKSVERRLRAETVSLHLNAGTEEDPKLHAFDVQLAYSSSGELRELAFVSRGKIGHGLDLLFSDLGVKLSRAVQHRNPDTGELDA